MINLSELSYLQTQRNYYYNNNMELELAAVEKEISKFVPFHTMDQYLNSLNK